MSRQGKRSEKRTIDKLQKRTYTYDELIRIVKVAVQAEVLEAEREYDVRYSTCLATALTKAPLKFGKVRVCRTVGKFFEQIEALKNGELSEEEVRKQALKVGVLIKQEDNALAVYIDPTLKF